MRCAYLPTDSITSLVRFGPCIPTSHCRSHLAVAAMGPDRIPIVHPHLRLPALPLPSTRSLYCDIRVLHLLHPYSVPLQALDSIMKRFRTHHTTTLQSWWRMVKVRRAFWRYRKSLIKLQRAWRGILIRRKYAAVAVQITRLQAHFRRRRDQKRYARLKVARANAGKIVVGSIKSFTARRRFLRMKRGFGRLQSHYKVRKAKLELQKLRASLKILQAAARMFIARIKFRRMKHVRIHGCALIQAQWRGYQQRRVYRQKRSAAIVIQSSWRSQMARRERWKRFALIVFVQSCAKRWLARGRFSRLRRKVVTIQSWWKMIVLRREYMKERVAARRIEAAVYGSIAKKALQVRTLVLCCAAAAAIASVVDQCSSTGIVATPSVLRLLSVF